MDDFSEHPTSFFTIESDGWQISGSLATCSFEMYTRYSISATTRLASHLLRPADFESVGPLPTNEQHRISKLQASRARFIVNSRMRFFGLGYLANIGVIKWLYN